YRAACRRRHGHRAVRPAGGRVGGTGVVAVRAAVAAVALDALRGDRSAGDGASGRVLPVWVRAGDGPDQRRAVPAVVLRAAPRGGHARAAFVVGGAARVRGDAGGPAGAASDPRGGRLALTLVGRGCASRAVQRRGVSPGSGMSGGPGRSETSTGVVAFWCGDTQRRIAQKRKIICNALPMM